MSFSLSPHNLRLKLLHGFREALRGLQVVVQAGDEVDGDGRPGLVLEMDAVHLRAGEGREDILAAVLWGGGLSTVPHATPPALGYAQGVVTQILPLLRSVIL